MPDRLHEFAESAAKRVGAFDPTFIITIITTIMSLISNCKQPAQAAVRSGTISMRQRATVACRMMQAGSIGLGNAVRLANGVCDEALHQQKLMQASADGDWCDQIVADAESD